MNISQAIYTSVDAEFFRGYHLVSRSTGLDEQVAQSLCRWSPSHGCLCDDELDTESLNFFQPTHDWFVLSRSIHGCPEFSQRGGLRVVTVNLIFHANQLARYENDVIACLRIALSTGLLMLPLTTPRNLPQVDFPVAKLHREREQIALGGMGDLTKPDRRLALVGADDPLVFLSGLFHDTPPIDRLMLSFATGLKPSAQRPFRIQFLPSVNSKQRNELSRQGFHVKNCPLPANLTA